MLLFRSDVRQSGTWRFLADKAVGIGALWAGVIAAPQ